MSSSKAERCVGEFKMQAEDEQDLPQPNSVSSEKGNPSGYSSEDTMNTDQMADDASRNQFDGEGQLMENEAEKDMEDPDNMESDEFSDDDDEWVDEEMDESEIDSMLEQGLPKSKRLDKSQVGRGTEKLTRKPHEGNSELTIKRIVVLEEKGGNTFEVLPGGWIQVRHSSGMPLYLHRKSRVCTLAKPYYLGPASVRRHSIPLSGIPCLSYRRALEKEKGEREMLEGQTKDGGASQQQAEKDPSAEKPADACVAGLSSGKGPKKSTTLTAEVVAEKVKLLKRKLELEKGSSKQVKLCDKSEEPIKGVNEAAKPDTENGTEEQITGVVASETSAEKVDENVAGRETEGSLVAEDRERKKTNLVGFPANKFMSAKHPDKNLPAGVRSLLPLAKVETARENAHLYSVNAMDLREYCKPLFKFTEVECKRFKTWSARRRHTKDQKRRSLERPTLPDNAQVIKFFDLNATKGSEEQMVKKFNDYVFNPNGKSSVCILHEFVQHALRKQPTYSFQELENAATPYSATVMINEIPYGRGYGSSKKTAKAEAAKATLEILIPQMKGQLNGNKTDNGSEFDIAEYFQQVEMNDVRIPKMCTSVSEPSPYTLLLTCVQRNFGQSGSTNVKFEMVPCSPSKGNPPNQFRMVAGDKEVVVTASNKREGKQLASQLLLSEIHPHVTNFGAFIKMYGNGSIKSVKEKKQEEQQITTLQSKASANSPNWAILNKLRQEMSKLAEHERDSKTKTKEERNVDKSDTNNDTSTVQLPNSPLDAPAIPMEVEEGENTT